MDHDHRIHLQEEGSRMNYQGLLAKNHTQPYNKSRTDSVTDIYQPIEATPIPQLLCHRANKDL